MTTIGEYALIGLLLCAVANGQEGPEKRVEEPKARLNVPMKTMGGRQFWADVAIYGGWRIQHNVFTDHYRLLDTKDWRRAWGTLAQCQNALDQAKQDGKAKLTSKKLCVLLHGFLRSSHSFGRLKGGLEDAGYEVYAVTYPSTQFEIDAFKTQVEGLLQGFSDDFEEIRFVTHSMGGLVARRVLSSNEYPKVKRFVMIGPPNQGAVLADLLLEWWPSEYVTGPAGKQLGTGVEGFAKNAGAPTCEFGVIAGARGDDEGWNPLIPGDDDGVVGVENTKLDGMADFVAVRATHTVLMNKPETVKQVIHFLEYGAFDHDEEETEPKP
jgi:pimeloyl-ACP methyl ester carboxylesterase